MKKSNSGFTLMEVVIVLAIIAILGAVIVPSFMGYTERARLRSDIQSARAVQNAIDLYKAEVGRDANTDAAEKVTVADEIDGAVGSVAKLITHLINSGYLNGAPQLQSKNASWSYIAADSKIIINITNPSDVIKNIQLSNVEAPFVNITP